MQQQSKIDATESFGKMAKRWGKEGLAEGKEWIFGKSPKPDPAAVLTKAKSIKDAAKAAGITLTDDAAFKAATEFLTPTLTEQYTKPALLAASAYGISEALGESEEDQKKRLEEEAEDKKRKELAKYHKTTGEYLFAQSRKYPPGHPLHDPDEYWKYVMRPPRRMAGTSQGAASARGLFGAHGGLAEYPPRDLLVEGRGTERSDEIPAMLSDGEFVMNSKSVRGADPSGRGNRYAGANNLYNMMRNFEMRT